MEKSEKDFPELKVENPYIIEEAKKDVDKEADEDLMKVDLIYKSPRLFRKSIIYKTWKLFGAQNQNEPKLNRSFKEK